MKISIDQICKLAKEFEEAIPATMRAGQMPHKPINEPIVNVVNFAPPGYKSETLKLLDILQEVVYLLKDKIKAKKDVKDFFPRIKKLILIAEESYNIK